MLHAMRPSSPLLPAAFALAALAASPLAAANTTDSGARDAAILDHGVATWYGPRHAGLRTTSGARFDPHKMTAAHPSLPMGTWVRVTDDSTGRSVVVLVNDREPPHGVRCIDLSEAAAMRLGMRGRGVADVTISAASRDDAVEVAEAPEDVVDAPARSRHGRRHRRRASR
jgi:rare lipoprotein A